jgi:O-antigen/teichoic acid export membrane protein
MSGTMATTAAGKLYQAMRGHLPNLGSVALTSGARAYTAAATLVGLILTVRWLGAEGRGIVVYVTTWIAVCAQLGSLTLWNVGVHRSAQAPGKSWLGPFLGGNIILCALSSAAIWLIVGLLYAGEHGRIFAGIPGTALALGFLALPFLMWEYLSSTLLSLVGRLNTHNLNQVGARTAGILIMVIAIPALGLGIYGFLVAFVCTELIIAAVALTVLAKECAPRFVEGLRQLPGMVADGLKAHLQTIGTLLFNSADILLIYYFHGAAAAAVYQFASAIFLTLTLIPQSALLSLQARVGAAGLHRTWHEQRVMIAMIVVLMAAAAVVVWPLAPWLTVTLATEEFRPAGNALRVMVFALPAVAFAVLMNVQWAARGRFLGLGLLYLSMGLLSLAINLVLIPRYGAIGAAVTILITWYSIPLVANILMAIKAQRDFERGGEPGSVLIEPIETPLAM